jgi:hypothetical protein
MRVRFKNEKELRNYGLIIDPSDQNRALPAKLAEQCPSIGQSRTLDQLVAAGKEQWADILEKDKHLTGQYWELAGTLQKIKDACGQDLHAWAAAYRAIGIDRRRVSELLLYRQLFADREMAAQCSVGQANKLIRRAKRIARADNQESAANPAQQEEQAAGPEDGGDHKQMSLDQNDGKAGSFTLNEIKHAITTLTDQDLDALYLFIVGTIGRRVARGTAIACLPAPRLEYEATNAQGNVVWEEV